jgi:hypothetical protein
MLRSLKPVEGDVQVTDCREDEGVVNADAIREKALKQRYDRAANNRSNEQTATLAG